MNTEEKGIHIFNVVDKLGKVVDEVYLDEFNGASEFKVDKNEHTQLIPRNKDRDILYITGSSGSGKSYYTLQYLKEYRKKYPRNDIYLFSSLKEDETLDKFKGLKRIDINNPEFIEEDFQITDFQDCMLVFDDVDCLTNKLIKEKVTEIMDMTLQTGRHTRTSMIYTSHVPANGAQTRLILNEAHTIIFFPRGLGNGALDYLLKKHIGMSQKQIYEIKKLRSRAVAYVKTFPSMILYQQGAYTF